jgi:hypothetical protein
MSFWTTSKVLPPAADMVHRQVKTRHASTTSDAMQLSRHGCSHTPLALICKTQLVDVHQTRDQALELLQRWGIAFAEATHLAYASVYTGMRNDGVAFPDTEEDDTPVFMQPRTGTDGGAATAKSASGPSLSGAAAAVPATASVSDEDTLKKDLSCVADKL